MSIWYERFRLTDEPNRDILTDQVRRRAGIGRSHWAARLQKIPDNSPYKKQIKDYIDNLPDNEQAGVSVVLHGPLGSGKTSIGTIILRNALARGARVLSIRASDMVDDLLSKKQRLLDNGAPLREGLTNVNVLLIDDLAIESEAWRRRCLEGILRRRYDDQLPTIITTNMGPKEMTSLPWLTSLFSDKSHYMGIEIKGINWRRDPPKDET